MISPNYTSQRICLILVLVFVAFTANPGKEKTSGFSQEGIPFLKQHCFSCHAGDEPAAELALDSFTDDLSLIENRDVWERVLDMLTTDQMPPSDSDQPSIEASESFVQ